MSFIPQKHWTFEEYLAWEELQEEKHEFYDGVLFDQASSPFAHNRIVINLHLLFAKQFQDEVCQTSGPEMKIQCPTGFIATPDVIVLCESPIFTTDKLDTITNATILIDVLTPETADSKGGQLFHELIQIKSLTHYVVISQERFSIQVLHRHNDRNGLLTSHTSGICKLESLNRQFELSFEDIYRGVTFPELKWFNGPRKLIH